MSMERRKYIYVLLIAALCYGQILASVHFVGHFHSHEHEASIESGWADHLNSRQQRELFALALAATHSEEHGPAQEFNLNEADCAAYHAYLGQGGVLCDYTVELGSQLHLSIAIPHVSVDVRIDAPDDGRIRGPPVLS